MSVSPGQFRNFSCRIQMGVKGPGASTCGFDLFDYSQPYAYLVDVTAEQCEAFQDDEDAFLSLFLAFVDFQVRNLFARAPPSKRSLQCFLPSSTWAPPWPATLRLRIALSVAQSLTQYLTCMHRPVMCARAHR